MRHSSGFISRLKCQDVSKVLSEFGHIPSHEHKGRLYYHCPFHNDTTPSFSVEKYGSSDRAVQRWVCPSCGVSGSGSLELYSQLSGHDVDSDETIASVAQLFGMVVEGGEDAHYYSRREEVNLQDSYSFEYRNEFTDDELEALGCQRRMVYTYEYEEDGSLVSKPLLDKDGHPRYSYSWGEGYYQKEYEKYRHNPSYVNFDTSELTRVFNLRSVQSFVTAAKRDSKGVLRSWRISSSRAYPIFNFIYGTSHHPWGKKYEPYYRVGHKGIKFMFWFGEGTPRPDLGCQIYGDVDVMNYLKTGNVEDIRDTKRGPHAVPLSDVTHTDGSGNTFTTKVFQDLIICSGPRDAMSIYFHTSAHVVWFNSETTDISRSSYELLRKCCKNIYICYDIDTTGVQEANRLAMKFLDLRVIRLPRALLQVIDPRTGKHGKDAENFFTLYEKIDKVERKRFYTHAEGRFSKLMEHSSHMKFFHERYRERKTKQGKEYYYDYEVSGNSAIQLAGARNLCRCVLDGDRSIYVKKSREDDLWDIIPEKEIETCARNELKSFAEEAEGVRCYDKLCDVITKSNNLSKGVWGQLPEVDINIRAFDENMEHFAFRNGVVKVTADAIRLMRYNESPYQFFRKGVVDDTFEGTLEPTFRIVRNVEGLMAKRDEIDSKRTPGMSDEAREVLEAQYLEYENLWGWKLEWLKPYEEQPIIVRFVYETGRIYWREERTGIPLRADWQQEQDLHFIVKVAAIGYSLSRYRDPSKAYIVQWTDYTAMINNLASGRTGKSILAKLKGGMRNMVLVLGQEIQKKENFSRNFSDFQLGVHSNILIDDLDTKITEEQFFNLNSDMKVKTLYENIVTIKSEDCPKVDITCNRKPNMDSSSVHGRFWMVPVGGPIGIHRINNIQVETTARQMFGCNIPSGLTGLEKKYYQNFMLWCCQFWFQHKEIIRPYTGNCPEISEIYNRVGSQDFVDWANDYFAGDEKFGQPLCRREMMLDYYEHLQRPVSVIGSNNLMAEFNRLLENYVRAHEGWVLNPRICLNVPDRKGGWRPSEKNTREKAYIANGWISETDDRGYRVSPKRMVYAKSQRWIYIYARNEDIPLREEDVVRPKE